ncbi:Amino acid/polyamine transporter I [Acididesulfobacillus acetoxydans]|uniref:Amino acid transporter n=1 Tax=Acididesulfobacillus acetoxydans TaxID=1561005 RepID=A0A8S0XZ45_9FIRM|nr:APC family permease [Acididesulfobacillus acetoxydans]CAA7602367.1 Amino acid/polyamine transporter I [Acididesulfobacillus acetoxydans]CEJ08398.1 Amino acid transporter [Acididesulfobacillus acetoxydans]
MVRLLKRFLIGPPLENKVLVHQRLTKFKALAVYSSDALSSVAYAAEEILWVTAPLGAFALSYSLPITGAILLLLLTLTVSYRQTIFAYPNGGGSYIVAKDNLGQIPGLVAGTALVIDYILTVSVSIASGVAAITSAFPVLLPYPVELCLFFLLILTIGNLRGLKESAAVFALPTYVFIVSLLTLIGVGIYKHALGLPIPPAPVNPILGSTPATAITLWVLMRAFSSGCSALTGVEAISNGVPNFKEPRSRNAAITLTIMSLIIVFQFGGVTYLAQILRVTPSSDQTVISQIATLLVGRGWFYYLVQGSTALILVMAANTSFSDFPMVASLLARDGYLPRSFGLRGDKLVFSNGIITLSALSALLLIVFHGDTHNLIPLYAVGVFLAFTLSQTGMVKHWWVKKDAHWRKQAAINGLGALFSGTALIVISVTKFIYGAWLVIVVIPLIVWMLSKIHMHYVDIARQLRVSDPITCVHPEHIKIIVPVAGFTKVVVNTIEYAKSLSKDIRAVHVAINEEKVGKIKGQWEHYYPDIPMEVIPSPYRSLMVPLRGYFDEIEKSAAPKELIMVLIPEFFTATWWQYLLHNQSGLLLKSYLTLSKNMVVASVPYHLSHGAGRNGVVEQPGQACEHTGR